jgi:predicted RNA-binding Zn-ribbon protein involved in translation (DUF1610 family)
MKQRREKKIYYTTCTICGRKTVRRSISQKYCPECAEEQHDQKMRMAKQETRDRYFAQKGMANVQTGHLDETLKICRARGISYGDYQRELELKRAGKIKV